MTTTDTRRSTGLLAQNDQGGTEVAAKRRVRQIADEQGHQIHCDRCGQLPIGPNRKAAIARARRHAAANPDHEVWMAHTVMTHFTVQPTG